MVGPLPGPSKRNRFWDDGLTSESSRTTSELVVFLKGEGGDGSGGGDGMIRGSIEMGYVRVMLW